MRSWSRRSVAAASSGSTRMASRSIRTVTEAMAKRPAGDGEESGVCSPVYQAGYAALVTRSCATARVVVTE